MSANFKRERAAAASRGFLALAIARLSFFRITWPEFLDIFELHFPFPGNSSFICNTTYLLRHVCRNSSYITVLKTFIYILLFLYLYYCCKSRELFSRAPLTWNKPIVKYEDLFIDSLKPMKYYYQRIFILCVFCSCIFSAVFISKYNYTHPFCFASINVSKILVNSGALLLDPAGDESRMKGHRTKDHWTKDHQARLLLDNIILPDHVPQPNVVIV